MSELATAARPYARAVLQEAVARRALARWSRLLARASGVVQDPRVAVLIGNPRVVQHELVDVLLGIAVPPGEAATDQERNFLQLLAENRRLPLLPQIAAQFEAEREQVEQLARVQIASARELSEPQADLLRRALEQRLGCRVQLEVRVDPRLLGGAVARYGDQVFDGSLRGRLERLGMLFDRT